MQFSKEKSLPRIDLQTIPVVIPEISSIVIPSPASRRGEISIAEPHLSNLDITNLQETLSKNRFRFLRLLVLWNPGSCFPANRQAAKL